VGQKNSEHKITKKTKCLSYYLYNLGFLSSFCSSHPRYQRCVIRGQLFARGGTALDHLLFFSPRREGAKRKDTANDRILVSNLSVLAPSRETSATQATDIRRISSMRWTISPSYAK
jgi:hypothetical protein